MAVERPFHLDWSAALERPGGCHATLASQESGQRSAVPRQVSVRLMVRRDQGAAEIGRLASAPRCCPPTEIHPKRLAVGSMVQNQQDGARM
jgi:hypothetical protein